MGRHPRLPLATLLCVVVTLGAAPAGRSAAPVPFTLHRDHLLLVSGAIGPLPDLVFLLDTGSSRTVISTPVAAALGLAGRPTAVHGMGARVEALEADIPNLSAGGFETGRHPTVVTDLVATAAALDLPRLDGIVGIDVLQRRSFAIDFARRRLEFGLARAMPNRAALVSHPLFLVIAATVERREVHLSVDTGSSHLVLFQLPHGSVPLAEGEATRMGGGTTVRLVRLGEVRIGRWRRRGIVALLAATGASGLTNTDGLLGLPALSANYVHFDFERREVGWSP
jgi:hypothetical protein